MKEFLYLLMLGIYLFYRTENNPKAETKVIELEGKIKGLQTQLDNSYKPGFSKFMPVIQVHHSKLWFTGINSNWELADVEMTEIKEALEDIKKFNTDRPESHSIPVLFGAIDNINVAIQNHNMNQFKSSYTFLTNTCNSCHKATKHEFSVVKIPDIPPFSNQVFTHEKSN